jgi:hypothetical protein
LVQIDSLEQRARINQLTFSVARWQDVSHILFAAFIYFNCKIVKTPTATKAREEISTYLESLEFEIFYVHLTIFQSNQILLHKISHRSLAETKLIIG